MKIQVVGHNGKGRGSRIIAWATRGFSHVSLRFVGVDYLLRQKISDMFGIVLTADHEIESIQGKGVHHKLFVESDNQAWFEFDFTPEQGERILIVACGLIGCKYDWKGIGGFILRGEKWHNINKWFCSELVAHCLKESGITLMNMPPHWIQPNVCVRTPVCWCVRASTS